MWVLYCVLCARCNNKSQGDLLGREPCHAMHHRPGQVDGQAGQAADGDETRRATGSLASLVVTASESGLGLEQAVEEPLDG